MIINSVKNRLNNSYFLTIQLFFLMFVRLCFLFLPSALYNLCCLRANYAFRCC